MICPKCGSGESKVVDSRPSKTSIRRKRVCLNCSFKFTTLEVVEELPLYVIKADKSKEIFDREKILKGIQRAAIKRNISYEAIERFVTTIEKKIRDSFGLEITSFQLGQLVMDELKNLDEVAYVRFASVYKKFANLRSFISEIENFEK